MANTPKKQKTLEEIQGDMSELYDKLETGQVELKMAAEMANIAGKNLKAHQLRLAERIFAAEIRGRLPVGAAALPNGNGGQVIEPAGAH